jgi:exodeoxyribonuclease-5
MATVTRRRPRRNSGLLGLSPEQDRVLYSLLQFARNPTKQVCRLAGPAGSGKTMLARELGYNVPLTHFCAFTGKAAHVLRQRGCRDATTIHSLIYVPQEDKETGAVHYHLRPESDLEMLWLIVVDEASMVNDHLAHDLLSFGKPILAIYDTAQLPPVYGLGYFTRREPDVQLTEVQRQALESPIIRLAEHIRRGGLLCRRPKDAGDAVRVIEDPDEEIDIAGYDVVLVGKNATRHDNNRQIRWLRGFADDDGPPEVGEVLVCLRNDSRVDAPVFNGSIWTISGLDRYQDRDGMGIYELALSSDHDGNTDVRVPEFCFGGGGELWPHYSRRRLQHFDWGYCLTVHKSQGSEWDNVLLVNEADCFGEHRQRWLYTGITRAAKRLTIA